MSYTHVLRITFKTQPCKLFPRLFSGPINLFSLEVPLFDMSPVSTTLKNRFSLVIRHLDKGKPWLVGVSGGLDSVVLLHLLLQSGFTQLRVCHLHHGIRKKTGMRDLAFCQNLAELSNLTFIYDILPRIERISGSLEADLRAARFRFFTQVALDEQVEGIFLGHQADDLAETFLWNLLRGTGRSGLAGMEAEATFVSDAGTLRIHRPLREFWRSDLEVYATDFGLKHVEDETNRSRRFTRNRLRHDLIPFLEKKLGRNVRENLVRTATILAAEDSLLDESVPHFSDHLPVAEMQLLPLALQRRAIHAWLQKKGVSNLSYEAVEGVRSLLDLENGPPRVNLAREKQARRRAGKITLTTQRPSA